MNLSSLSEPGSERPSGILVSLLGRATGATLRDFCITSLAPSPEWSHPVQNGPGGFLHQPKFLGTGFIILFIHLCFHTFPVSLPPQGVMSQGFKSELFPSPSCDLGHNHPLWVPLCPFCGTHLPPLPSEPLPMHSPSHQGPSQLLVAISRQQAFTEHALRDGPFARRKDHRDKSGSPFVALAPCPGHLGKR